MWSNRGNAGFHLDYKNDIMYAFYGTHDGSSIANSVSIVSLNDMTGQTVTIPATYKHVSCARNNNIIYTVASSPNVKMLEFNLTTNTSELGAIFPAGFGDSMLRSQVWNAELCVYDGHILIPCMLYKSGVSNSDFMALVKYNIATKTFTNSYVKLFDKTSGTWIPGMQLQGDIAYCMSYTGKDTLNIHAINLKTNTISTKTVSNVPSRISAYNKIVNTNGEYPGKIFLHSSRTRATNYPCEFGISVIDIASSKLTYTEDLIQLDGAKDLTNTPYLWKHHLLSGGGYETSSATLNLTKIGYIYPHIFE